MRSLLLGAAIAALLLTVPARAGDRDRKTYERKLARLTSRLASEYVELGHFARKKGLYDSARAAFARCLEIDADHAEARAWLGFERARGEWVLDEGRAAAKLPSEGDPGRHWKETSAEQKRKNQAAFRKRREVFEREFARRFAELAEWCLERDLVDEAGAAIAHGKEIAPENEALAKLAEGLSGEVAVRETPLRLERVRLAAPRLCHYGPGNRLDLGAPLRLGPLTVVPGRDKRGGASFRWSSGELRGAASLGSAREGLVTLGEGESRVTVFAFADLLGRFHLTNPEVLTAEISGRKIAFIDADFDGRYFEPDEDWYGFPDSPFAVPFSARILFGDKSLEFVGHDGDTATFRIGAVQDGLSFDELRVVRLLNDLRLHYGLWPVEIDGRLSKNCRLHNRWIQMNPTLPAHVEKKGTEGYTPEGAKAGLRCLISRQTGTAEAVFDLFDTPIHGYPLTAPSFTRTALAYQPGICSVWAYPTDGLSFPPKSARYPFVFPPNLATGIPLDWREESPDPRGSDADSKRWGHPIRIYVTPAIGVTEEEISGVSARLVVHDSGREVPLRIVSRPSDIPDLRTSRIAFLLIPRVSLSPRTTYRVHAEWEREGVRESWDGTFTTGTQQGQTRKSWKH